MSTQFGLFNESSQNRPLAFTQRPDDFAHYYGQEHLSSKIQRLNKNNISHIILHGPAGCGKTTLSYLIANAVDMPIHTFNAVLGGVSELRALIKECISNSELQGKKSIIFIDEIHRFNKSQQDALLPYLERADFILLGATTEYPKTTLNKAIQSRVQIWQLNKLNESAIKDILNKANRDKESSINKDVINLIADISDGDARFALSKLEILIQNKDKIKNLSTDEIKQSYLEINREYDKNSNRHYDVISAFIKSIRGSDANAAIFWLAVMLDGGEDIEFIARRLIISASEDIGNADPRALTIATNAHYGIKTIGMPEARIILAQATAYLANAPKSNSSYMAINEALSFVKNNKTIEVPTHLQNHHPDKKNYKYPHSYPNHYVEQDYTGLKEKFFEFGNLGYEKMQKDYLLKIKELNQGNKSMP
ncbi:MAG: replication-associated recombination protein A [Bacteriovoracaceae bacterium]|jgi:putative ATPase|nr:replication-associated recombination protein A [Bacteriovoracaceae bacterium]